MPKGKQAEPPSTYSRRQAKMRLAMATQPGRARRAKGSEGKGKEGKGKEGNSSTHED